MTATLGGAQPPPAAPGAATRAVPSPLAPIGTANQPVRVVAFAGGGFDTIMQLGVTHALVVMRAQPPDVVAGISAGAIHSAVLAEVMRAGDTDADDRRRLYKQVETFARFLEAELAAPSRLMSVLLPDAYQVHSRNPLEPLAVPTQSKVERVDREAGASSRIELIHLINDFVSFRVTVGDVTRMGRALLGYQAAGEARSSARRRWGQFKAMLLLCGVFLTAIGPLASVTRYVEWPIIKSLLRGVAARFGWRRRRRAGRSAASIIYRFKPWGWITNAVWWTAAVITNAGLWLGLVGFTLCLLVLVVVNFSIELASRVVKRVHDHPPRPSGPTPSDRSPVTRVIRAAFGLLMRERRLQQSLLESEVLRAWFIQLFDSTYYGPIDAGAMDHAVAESFRNAHGAADRPATPKLVREYAEARTPIHLGLAVANLNTGKLELLPSQTSVVDGLMAATAFVPWFEPQELENDRRQKQWYVDALNVSREPSQLVVDFLRDRVHPQATEVTIYPVNHLTTRNLAMPDGAPPLPTWVEVAKRASELKQFRDARLEWRLMGIVTDVIPPNVVSYPIGGSTPRTLLRCDIRPIEPDMTSHTAEHIFDAGSEEERRDVMLKAIADGCRATMESLFQGAIGDEMRARRVRDPALPSDRAPCWDVVTRRLRHDSEMPNATPEAGPGFTEICRKCALAASLAQHRDMHLTVLAPGREPVADWPCAKVYTNGQPVAHVVASESKQSRSQFVQEEPRPSHESSDRIEDERLEGWPKDRNCVPGNQRPLLSLLFSGGVFRGVYLVGVVNALKEIGAQPDIVAGASVGSVSAVLAADVFARPSGDRQLQMARFASVFLTLDRLILTDTFADFIRTITLRAASSEFSLRHLDRVLRRYDEASTEQFNKDLRRVTAGLERLFYLSPFEFMRLTDDFRSGRNTSAKAGLGRQLHRWLQRDTVHEELLGAEPLARIIDAYVLHRLYPARSRNRSDVEFQSFLEQGIYLIATTTNLTKAQLELLGDVISHGSTGGSQRGDVPASLLEGLLASSAFPGIFRPRWSWEVFRGAKNCDQYTDGGVMDNLPLDAVAHFIYSASLERGRGARNQGRMVTARPQFGCVDVPHLLFTASLEEDVVELDARGIRNVARHWERSFARTRRLGYNRKIDSYKSAQHQLRAVYEQRQDLRGEQNPLANLEVVDVRPKWLCDTYAFHPMMGFRKQRQAESIAHGCATTFRRFQGMAADPQTSVWIKAWGLEVDRIPWSPGSAVIPDSTRDFTRGECVFRSNAVCPFSPAGLATETRLDSATKRELYEIYYACRRPQTHEAPPES